MNMNDRFLVPQMHPTQILLALHVWVSAQKAHCGFPTRTVHLSDLVQVWDQAKWNPSDLSKGFGLVCGAFIPCRMIVIPDAPHPYIQLDPIAFDTYYGAGAAFHAIVAYRDRRLAGETADNVAARAASAEDPENAIPAPIALPMDREMGVRASRPGEKAARKTARAHVALEHLPPDGGATETAPQIPLPLEAVVYSLQGTLALKEHNTHLAGMSPEERQADNRKWFAEMTRTRPVSPATVDEFNSAALGRLLSKEEAKEQALDTRLPKMILDTTDLVLGQLTSLED